MKAALKAMKPYLFWIITSIILIAEIVWVVTDKPLPEKIAQDSKMKRRCQLGKRLMLR